MVARRRCNPGSASVRLNIGEEHLLYVVTVRGSRGIFSLADPHGNVLLSEADTTSSRGTFERKWPRAKSEVPSQDSIIHALALQFAAAVRYGYRVEKRAKDGSLVSVVKDCVFESNNPEDERFESLRVRLQR